MSMLGTLSAGVWGWGLILVLSMLVLAVGNGRIGTGIFAVLLTIPLGWAVRLVRRLGGMLIER